MRKTNYWRELTAEEYNELKSETMVFYRIADVIILTLLIAFLIILGFTIHDAIAGNGAEKIDAIYGAIFTALGIGIMIYGRRFIYHLGFDDFRKHNLVACEGTFIRCEEGTHSRNGTTRYDYYAIVSMPDGAEVKIECSLFEIENVARGDTVTVVKPRDSSREQRFMVLTQGGDND